MKYTHRGRYGIRARAELLGMIALGATAALMTSSATPRPVGAEDNGRPAQLTLSDTRGNTPASVSPVIFPAQDIPLLFSHARHVGGFDGTRPRLACTECHQAALSSRSSLDNLIPRESACTPCHAIERTELDKKVAPGEPPAACSACHLGIDRGGADPGVALSGDSSGAADPGVALAGDSSETNALPAGQALVLVVPRVYVPAPHIKFDHAQHVVDESIPCAQCHGDMISPPVDLATRAQLPTMDTCLACHQKVANGRRRERLSACTTCHLAAAGGVLETSFPSGELMPSGTLQGAEHDTLFRTQHAAVAQNNTDYCESCHKQSFCVDCHDGVIKPMDFHGNDYVQLHSVDARRNTMECEACHRRQTFCTGCHSRSGVSSDSRGGSEYERVSAARRFHPEAWAAADGRGSDHHAFEAQRNIKQCASCHREQFCVRCHGRTMDNMGINPHPAGWSGSRRCRSLFASTGRMCLRCHLTLDEARCVP